MPTPEQPRRTFLKSLAAGAAVIASTNTARTQEPAFQKADGASYAPKGKPNPVVKPGEFVIAAAYFDHGHINGQCNGLTEAGATLKWAFDPDPKKLADFVARYPGVRAAASLDEILADPEIKLVATAAIPNLRGPIGCKVMRAGKDYFTDKPPFTTLAQLNEARAVAAETGKKFMVYYGERIHSESAMFATDLVQQGAIGRVLQVIGLGPHREGKGRPAWFYDPEAYGGIICDIGSHQFEQFLTYTGAKDATVMHAAVANYAHPDHPGFEDFGEVNLLGNNGATNYIRVDWFTPAGLSTWGDGRTFILGEKGYIELRKYVDVAREKTGDHVFLVDEKGEQKIDIDGNVGFRFFGELVLDCIHRTEKAMTQAHAFKAAELCLKAQAAARRITG
ncbi:MAG TPA: Gfo/Idh/MocA family oxidoreductase [Opitutaceae bacterium]